MRTPILAMATATTLAAGTLGMAAPAEARVSTGTAVAAGILGLGAGALIASDHPRHYYSDGYYAPPPPPPPPAPVAYYAPPPPPPPAYSYEYVQRCRVFEHWSPYWGRYVRDRRCY